jgi:hypothetical protein
VLVRCAGRTRCVGTLWIEDRRLATVTLVNGHLPGGVLRTLSRRYSLGPGRAARLRFAVPRSVLVHAWARRELRVRLMLASPAEPFALASRYRVDAWRPATVTRRPRRAR